MYIYNVCAFIPLIQFCKSILLTLLVLIHLWTCWGRPLTILNPNTGHEEAKFIAKGEEDDISTDPNDRHENTNATDKKVPTL